MKTGGLWFKSPLPLVLDFLIHLVFPCLQPRFIKNTRLVMFVVLARTMGRDAVKDGRVEEG